MGWCNSISSVAPDDPNDEPTARAKPKKRGWGLKKKESGRLEGPAPSVDEAPSRDGLHSAPSGDTAAKQEKMASPFKVMDRAGLHSAPPDRKSAPAVASEVPLPKTETLGEFLVEGVGGVSAADADAYCADILGAPLRCLGCLHCLGCCLGCLGCLHCLGCCLGCLGCLHCLGCCLDCLGCLCAQSPPHPTRPAQVPRWSRSFALPSGPRACVGWRRCRH